LSNATNIIQEQALQRRRMRGNWAVSPLWEGKILLGVLKEQGLAGRGLVSAFEQLAPTMVGASRLDMNRTYSKQTGRELSDYILVQQADKAVRYSQLPPEAEHLRQALAKSVRSQQSETESGGCEDQALGAGHGKTGLSARYAVVERIRGSLGSERDTISARTSGVLLSTSELAVLTGFAPKTIRRWASRRLLNFIRVGNQFRSRPAAVELFLAQREIGK
jgi:excisionase family DNA binding protein